MRHVQETATAGSDGLCQDQDSMQLAKPLGHEWTSPQGSTGLPHYFPARP